MCGLVYGVVCGLGEAMAQDCLQNGPQTTFCLSAVKWFSFVSAVKWFSLVARGLVLGLV